MPHPVPKRPNVASPSSGKMAEHFSGYSTSQMVELIRQIRPGPDDDEDLSIAEAHGRGEASHIDLLVALQERGSREVFEVAGSLCHDEQPEERILGLRILRELGPYAQRPVFEETWALLESMSETETDVDVLVWVIACLHYTDDPRAR